MSEEWCELCGRRRPVEQMESFPILVRSNDGYGQDWDFRYRCKPNCEAVE